MTFNLLLRLCVYHKISKIYISISNLAKRAMWGNRGNQSLVKLRTEIYCYLKFIAKDGFFLLFFMNMFSNSCLSSVDEIGREMGSSSRGCASVLLIGTEPIVYWDWADFCQSLQPYFLKATQNDCIFFKTGLICHQARSIFQQFCCQPKKKKSLKISSSSCY